MTDEHRKHQVFSEIDQDALDPKNDLDNLSLEAVECLGYDQDEAYEELKHLNQIEKELTTAYNN